MPKISTMFTSTSAYENKILNNNTLSKILTKKTLRRPN